MLAGPLSLFRMLPVLIAWVGPVPILALFILINRRWLRHPYRAAALMYTLSLLTGIVISVTQKLDNLSGAIVAGIYAPLGYALMFTLLGGTSRLIQKAGIALPSGQHSLFKTSGRIGHGIAGAFVGGVIGIFTGALLGFLFAALLQFEFFPLTNLSELAPEAVITVSGYVLGVIGMVAGAMLGWRGSTPINKEGGSHDE